MNFSTSLRIATGLGTPAISITASRVTGTSAAMSALRMHSFPTSAGRIVVPSTPNTTRSILTLVIVISSADRTMASEFPRAMSGGSRLCHQLAAPNSGAGDRASSAGSDSERRRRELLLQEAAVRQERLHVVLVHAH